MHSLTPFPLSLSIYLSILNQGAVTEMRQWFRGYPMGGLLLMLLCRVALTLLGTNIMVPAGIFMPVHLIGGILGRFVGYLIYYMNGSNAIPDNTLIQVPGYALVGAVAFASGVTHTISAAVIAVEMSGNLEMILPCLIVAVISAGITKAHGLSVYDQVDKPLPLPLHNSLFRFLSTSSSFTSKPNHSLFVTTSCLLGHDEQGSGDLPTAPARATGRQQAGGGHCHGPPGYVYGHPRHGA